MILLPSVGGVTAAVDELSGDAPALADGEGPVEVEPGDGEPLSSTKVVVLSPPHPAIATAAMLTNTPTANRFMSL